MGGAGAVSADQHLPARIVCRAGAEGSWRSASRSTAMWSAAVFDPAFPLRSSDRQRLTGAAGSVVDERPQRVEAEAPS